MRIAALILGILLSIWVFIEGWIASSLFSWAKDDNMAGVTGTGILIGMLGALAASLAIAFPLFSSITFAACGGLGYIIAANGYGNHWLYGSLYLGLGVMCFFGWRGKKQERKAALAEVNRQRERDARMEQLLVQAHARASTPRMRPIDTEPDTVATPTVTRSPGLQQVCPACGSANPGTSKFCGECGAALEKKADEPAPSWRCVRCGQDNDGASNFCAQCGLSRNVSLAPPIPPAASVKTSSPDMISREPGSAGSFFDGIAKNRPPEAKDA